MYKVVFFPDGKAPRILQGTAATLPAAEKAAAYAARGWARRRGLVRPDEHGLIAVLQATSTLQLSNAITTYAIQNKWIDGWGCFG